MRLAGDPADVVTPVDHWSPRGALTPQAGDRCLVSPDDEGHLWVAEWVPEADPPEPEPYPDNGVEVGAVQAFAIAPGAKWLPCDGAGVTGSYPVLRAGLVAAGSPYGTSGANPRVPDLRGRAAIGAGTGAGLKERIAGDIPGAEKHRLDLTEMPAHSHPGSSSTAANHAVSGSPATINTATGGGGGHNLALTIASQGGGLPHDNMQPSLVIPYYIRAVA